MSIESQLGLDQPTRAALADLESTIRRRYPDATFTVTTGEDPEGIFLKATVDLDDVEEMIDQELLDRIFAIQVEQGLSIYVIPFQPMSRGQQSQAEPEPVSPVSPDRPVRTLPDGSTVSR